jgi:hypothetical protein
MGGRSSAHPSRPQISDPVRLDRGLGLLLPLWAVVQNRVPGWRAEVRLNGILPRAFAEAMLPKAQAPSRVGLGQPLLLGKFGLCLLLCMPPKGWCLSLNFCTFFEHRLRERIPVGGS